ncbi:MAG: hypothetical protein HXL46_02670 [Solobacterium sp.]|uniref:hypothetical protein n=1 Tax=Solobacterium sp. TaxID=2060878 RepID=UPI001CAD799A|nr:hypothetical protein [Solobacterium sp.]MBF1088952.1 hypothetical protein [Solobacterium sp.]
MSQKKNPDYSLKDLQPSQFYISQAKLSNIQAWFCKDDLSNFEPLPVKVLDGIPILTDGHTRAVSAILAGLESVPLVYDEDELDWNLYRYCVEQCNQKGIHSPYDLVDRVISAQEYEEKWIGWCEQIPSKLQQNQK